MFFGHWLNRFSLRKNKTLCMRLSKVLNPRSDQTSLQAESGSTPSDARAKWERYSFDSRNNRCPGLQQWKKAQLNRARGAGSFLLFIFPVIG